MTDPHDLDHTLREMAERLYYERRASWDDECCVVHDALRKAAVMGVREAATVISRPGDTVLIRHLATQLEALQDE